VQRTDGRTSIGIVWGTPAQLHPPAASVPEAAQCSSSYHRPPRSILLGLRAKNHGAPKQRASASLCRKTRRTSKARRTRISDPLIARHRVIPRIHRSRTLPAQGKSAAKWARRRAHRDKRTREKKAKQEYRKEHPPYRNSKQSCPPPRSTRLRYCSQAFCRQRYPQYVHQLRCFLSEKRAENSPFLYVRQAD
jgi:hypothetical protein